MSDGEVTLDRYVAATRPLLLSASRINTPLQWTAKDWAVLSQEPQEDLLDMVAFRREFDRAEFLRDGVAILPSVMTERGRQRWIAATQEAQRRNDALIRAAPSWPSSIAWTDLGREPPSETLSSEQIQAALGTSQSIAQGDDSAGVRTLRQHSVIPEYFPAGHVEDLMKIMVHPQMLEIHRTMLGSDEIRVDHNQLLNRRSGYGGGDWHSHKIGSGYDDCGTLSNLEAYDSQPNLCLSLCYPEGFSQVNDGGLGVIRGSHLCRDPSGLRAGADPERGLSADDVLRDGWLRGRRHPFTGELMKLERFSLPPGSICSVLSHGAHGVSPKGEGRPTRLCTLYAYRKAAGDQILSPGRQIPPVWQEKRRRGMLPPVLTELFAGVGDIFDQGGLVGSIDRRKPAL